MDGKMKPSKISIFTQDGRKLADGIATVDCLKPYGELPKKMEWKKPEDYSLEFEIGLTKENEEEMKEVKAIHELLLEEMEKELSKYYDEVWKKAEDIMRNYVTPPIKGEITKGKARWRGLEIVWQKTDTYDAFVGIKQRDWLIFPDGKKIPWDSLVNIEKT